MWKLAADAADSMEDSTEGKGCNSDNSGGGGVSACCSGEAAYEVNWAATKGGNEVRECICGDWFGEPGTWSESWHGRLVRVYIRGLTGVRSLLSSSVAEAAASMRSSQRLPSMAAAACGSAEKAFRS